MPQVSLIVAMSRNRVIGRDNRMPWHQPADLKRFKQLTLGHHIVMGRKTWESIGRLLPGRTTVIVTRDPGYAVPGAKIAASLDAALAACGDDPEIFVIGGEQIFRLALPLASRIYLTTIEAEIAGDTHMPQIDWSAWRLHTAETQAADSDNRLAWRFEIYQRVAAAGR